MPTINNNFAGVYLGNDLSGHPEFAHDPGALFALRPGSGSGHLLVHPPVFSLDGARIVARPDEFTAAGPPENVFGDVWEHRLSGRLTHVDAALEIVLRVAKNSPLVRFRYRLLTHFPTRLTKTDDGRADDLVYLSASLTDFPDAAEVRFSEFSELFHSFVPSERPLAERHFEAGVGGVFGPLLVATNENGNGPSALLAYEHGSQVPDAFLAYVLAAPGRVVTLRAVKGNYYHGQVVGPDAPFETPWFHVALVDGDADHLARSYRTFVLRHLSPNEESRKPYVFYNTWNYQERVHAWKKQPYLSEMNEARTLAEIEVAAKMGIDVFVIDTGWYEKTGDWQVSRERFPNGLAPLKAKLDEHNMKLGLWFNPTVAAVSSDMHARHRDCLMTRNGKPGDPHPVWETEPSQDLCLVSRYGDAFADELIRLHNEIGVTYFKWDAIGQYGCDAPGHGHGTLENTPEERRNAYAFQLGAAMTRVVDKLCKACPDAIVDFDITEGGRTVGLQFLSAGKYFLINNGPYSHNYNLPTPADGNVNLFFYPGPARAWICRAPLTFDRWLPSVLFLTHYLPDDNYRHGWEIEQETPAENQWITLASLVLGQNGIWGDLPALSDEGIARFAECLTRYKQIRDDITQATLIRTGAVGGSPEIYEKINPETGKGVICLFCSSPGVYTYVTENPVAENCWTSDKANVTITLGQADHARLDVRFKTEGAKIVFVGANP